MASLKEVRERIKSVMNTQQITKAMKMVSAAKLRRAQQAITQVRPYADRLNRTLSNIVSNLDGEGATSYSKVRDVKNVLVVIISSNRGLAGAFNTNVSKEAIALIDRKYARQRAAGNVTVMFIGRKSYDFFRRRFRDLKINDEQIHLYDHINYERVSEQSAKLMEAFTKGQYDAIELVYTRFKNAATTFPVSEQWLPLPKMEPAKGQAPSKIKADYIFEPNKEQLLESLVPSILQLTFYKAMLDTQASEHGARMTAMDKATENAEELLKALRINYNKARQESITKELLEIVAGAAALEG